MILSRNQVPENHQWDLSSLFASKEAWEAEFSQLQQELDTTWSKKLASFKNTLDQSPKVVFQVLDLVNGMARKVDKLYCFAHLKHDEDLSCEFYSQKQQYATHICQLFEELTSWIEPEILSLSEKTLEQILQDTDGAIYHSYLKRLRELQPHVLSEKEESILSMSQKALMTPQRAFTVLNNSDFHFDSVQDEAGRKNELTHGQYGLYIRSYDRQLRQNAFISLHTQFHKYQHTITELLSGHVQKHLFFTRAKKFKNCLEASLKPNHIPTDIYHTLIESVRSKLHTLHKYYQVKKNCLGYETLHYYDLQVPLTPELDFTFSYEDARSLVIESVGVLGNQYQKTVKEGLEKRRWVDRYENAHKRSGAYSSGCYDSEPFILMNYQGSINDVFTLAHEVGHSMHSYYSCKHQPYHYHKYPIFLAEIASTFNEELLFYYMMKQTNDPHLKLYLINQKIDAIRSTLFRQTLFAEFELAIHTQVENNQPITAEYLNKLYFRLVEEYSGKSVFLDPEVAIEWARIPHFYYNFYVYQYATGISAALHLANTVLNESDPASVTTYLDFLKSGCSINSIPLLQQSGVHMSAGEPIHFAIQIMHDLIDHFVDLKKSLDTPA